MNEDEIYRRIVTLEELFKNVRIVGDGQLDVQGNFASGFAINVKPPDSPKPAVIPVTYNCVDGACVDPGDGTGTYATLELCEAACERCPDAVCGDQPTTMRLQVTVSGTYPTSAECNSEVDYEISPSIVGDSGAINITDQDLSGDCSSYIVEMADAPYSFSCENPDCDDSGAIQATAQINCQEDDATWLLGIAVVGTTPFCHPGFAAFGGDPIVLMNIGANPIGSHHFTFDDPNIATIHYDVTVTIT